MMFNDDNDLLTASRCIECHLILSSPVLLPCGNSVCQKHVGSTWTQFFCASCSLNHPVPPDQGFPLNHTLIDFIAQKKKQERGPPCSISLQNIKTIDKALNACALLDSVLIDFDTLESDPDAYIDECIGLLRKRVTFHQEQLKVEIDRRASKVLDELEEFQIECKASLAQSPLLVLDELNGVGDLMARKNQVEAWKAELRRSNSGRESNGGEEGEETVVRLMTIVKSCETEANELSSKAASIKRLLLKERFDEFKKKQEEFCNLEISAKMYKFFES